MDVGDDGVLSAPKGRCTCCVCLKLSSRKTLTYVQKRVHVLGTNYLEMVYRWNINRVEADDTLCTTCALSKRSTEQHEGPPVHSLDYTTLKKNTL